MKVTRVLVVDDCRLTRLACQIELGRQRQTLLASNPADALELSVNDLDLAIVDQRLGERGMFSAGILLVKELKQRRPDLCVVMVSGLLTSEADSMARNRGADLVVEKMEDTRGWWWIPVATILAFAEDGIAPSKSSGVDLRSLARVDRDYILDIYRRCNGNVARAACILQMPRSTLHARVEELLSGDPRE